MAEHFAANTWFGIETCCNCSMVFAMPLDLQRELKRKPGTAFYCPKGHGQHYIGERLVEFVRNAPRSPESDFEEPEPTF